MYPGLLPEEVPFPESLGCLESEPEQVEGKLGNHDAYVGSECSGWKSVRWGDDGGGTRWVTSNNWGTWRN